MLKNAQGSSGNKPKQQLDFGALPTPMAQALVPWARNRPELRHVDDGLVVWMLMQTPEWEEIIGKRLDAVDALRSPRGYRFDWKSRDLEAVSLFARAAGKDTMHSALKELGSPARLRESTQLGFMRDLTFTATGDPRFANRLPSEATMTHHSKRFGGEAKHVAYRELAAKLRERLLKTPEMAELACIIQADGTGITTSFSPRTASDRGRSKAKTHKTQSATAPGAGVRHTPAHGPEIGWQWLPVLAQNGVPLAGFDVQSISQGEAKAMLHNIEDYRANVRPLLPDDAVVVVTQDGNFADDPVRAAWRKAGVVENIHQVSHVNEERAETFRNDIIDIRDRTMKHAHKWWLDGHFQPHCECGKGRAERDVEVLNGKSSVRTVGRCRNGCGSVTITSGQWKKVPQSKTGRGKRNKESIRRVTAGDKPNWAIGNPLTYDAVLAKEYGKDRFGNNEGFFGSFSQRFGLLKEPGPWRSAEDIETELAIALAFIYTLTLEYYEMRAGKDKTLGPAGPIPAASNAPLKTRNAASNATFACAAGVKGAATAVQMTHAAATAHPGPALHAIRHTSNAPQARPAGTLGSACTSKPKLRRSSAARCVEDAFRGASAAGVLRPPTPSSPPPACENGVAGFDAVFGPGRGRTIGPRMPPGSAAPG